MTTAQTHNITNCQSNDESRSFEESNLMTDSVVNHLLQSVCLNVTGKHSFFVFETFFCKFIHLFRFLPRIGKRVN